MNFQDGAKTYAAYLETPEGRLRSELAFANLLEFLPRARPLRALDLGGGTGEIALRLAHLGVRVMLVDSSADMLDFARRAAEEAGVAPLIEVQHGEADRVTGRFDVVVCHNVLEYVDDPAAALLAAARAMADPAILSLLVRNRAGEVLKTAIRAGDLVSAEEKLDAEWTIESLFGGRARMFTPECLRSILKAARLEPIAERGVRVVSDYLPAGGDYQRILEVEHRLGSRPEFAAVARYSHWVARHE